MSVLHSKIEGIDNTMTGIISHDWNVLDNDDENTMPRRSHRYKFTRD